MIRYKDIEVSQAGNFERTGSRQILPEIVQNYTAAEFGYDPFNVEINCVREGLRDLFSNR